VVEHLPSKQGSNPSTTIKIEHLPHKQEALSSNPSPQKGGKKKARKKDFEYSLQ
jgi:hypothetical protein